jgi:hypothetical protein
MFADHRSKEETSFVTKYSHWIFFSFDSYIHRFNPNHSMYAVYSCQEEAILYGGIIKL